MSEYPRMMYRPGTKSRIWGAMYDTRKVADAEEQEAALAEGWSLRPDEGPSKRGEPEERLEAAKPALRAEYKRIVGKAPFNGWDETTLRAKIAAAKEASRAD
jgi:hypothetical protein